MSSIAIAESIVILLAIYAGGRVFAFAFLGAGMRRLDPAAGGPGYAFPTLMLPDAAPLRRLLALRWGRGASRPIEHNAPRDAVPLGEYG